MKRRYTSFGGVAALQAKLASFENDSVFKLNDYIARLTGRRKYFYRKQGFAAQKKVPAKVEYFREKNFFFEEIMLEYYLPVHCG